MTRILRLLWVSVVIFFLFIPPLFVEARGFNGGAVLHPTTRPALASGWAIADVEGCGVTDCEIVYIDVHISTKLLDGTTLIIVCRNEDGSTESGEMIIEQGEGLVTLSIFMFMGDYEPKKLFVYDSDMNLLATGHVFLVW